jgi:hypothetical protein
MADFLFDRKIFKLYKDSNTYLLTGIVGECVREHALSGKWVWLAHEEAECGALHRWRVRTQSPMEQRGMGSPRSRPPPPSPSLVIDNLIEQLICSRRATKGFLAYKL